MINIIRKTNLVSNSEPEYLLEVEEKLGNGIKKKHFFELGKNTKYHLMEFKKQIEIVLGIKEFQDKLNCTKDTAEKIAKKFNDYQCRQICDNQHNKVCIDCVTTYCGDLENHIFLELKTRRSVIIHEEFLTIKKKITNDHEGFSLCQNCYLQNKACYECAIICESPLEREFFIGLQISPKVQLQVSIDRLGKTYSFEEKEKCTHLLSRPDFFIETANNNLCIFADGHTYHERTEEQALRDRSIDRELQKLGFTVLRYTGKEIRDNMYKIQKEIKYLL